MYCIRYIKKNLGVVSKTAFKARPTQAFYQFFLEWRNPVKGICVFWSQNPLKGYSTSSNVLSNTSKTPVGRHATEGDHANRSTSSVSVSVSRANSVSGSASRADNVCGGFYCTGT